MLHADEKKLVQKDFREIIGRSGLFGTLIRPIQVNVGSFDGPIEEDEQVIVSSFPLEWHPGSPDDLKQVGTSGIIHVLPGLAIKENDIVEFETRRYRVTDIREESLFSTVTHKVVQLEREYRG